MFENLITLCMTNVWTRRASWFACVTASLLLLSVLIQAPMTWYADFQLTKAVPVIKDFPISDEKTTDYVTQIPDWHLFGNPAKVEDTAFLPITSLSLRLIGVVQSFPEKNSSVIISEANQSGKVYLVGDTLPIGVKVNAITRDGVILENAGRLEKLPLQRQPLSFQGLPKKLLQEE